MYIDVKTSTILMITILILIPSIPLQGLSQDINKFTTSEPYVGSLVPSVWVKQLQYYTKYSADIEVVDNETYVIIGNSYYNDFFIMKLDKHGSILWQKIYGSTYDDYALDIEVSDDGYVVVGYSRASALILKLDSDGNIVWQKKYSGVGRFVDVEVTDDGYIVAGYTSSFGNGGYDSLVLKLDRYGNIVWEKAYGGSNDDKALDIEATYDGNYIVGGITNSFGSEGNNVWLMKLDENGNIIWQNVYGSGVFYDVEVTDNNKFIVACGDVIKLDKNGNIVWQKKYTYGIVEDVEAVNNGTYVVTGSYYGGGSVWNIWVAELDNNGGILWQKAYNISNNDLGVDIEVVHDGTFIIIGYRNSYEHFVNILKIGDDGFLDGCIRNIIFDANASVIDASRNITKTGASVLNVPGDMSDTSFSVLSANMYFKTLCFFCAYGTINIRVFNAMGQPMPDEDGIISIDLYQMNNSEWVFVKSYEVNYSGGEEYVLMSIDGLSFGERYLAKVYSLSIGGLGLREYWGSLEFNYTGEYSPSPGVLDFYRITPYVEMINIPTKVLEGQVFNVSMSIYVPEPVDGLKIKIIFDRDGELPWDSFFIYNVTGWISAGSLPIQFQHVLDNEGSYHIYALLYSGNGEVLYDHYMRNKPINVGSTITIKIYNMPNQPMPDGGGTVSAELYKYVDGELIFVDSVNTTYTGGEEHLQVDFRDMEFAHYLIKVFNKPNYGLGFTEYWGSMEFDYSLQDYIEFYRQTPYITNVILPTSSLVGQPITINVGVKIPETIGGVSIEIIFDRDEQPPWDSVYVYNCSTNLYPGDKTFQLQYILKQEGSYKAYVVLYSSDGEYIYSQWDWTEPIDLIYGSLTLRTHNIGTTPLPSSGGIIQVDLYKRSGWTWEYITTIKTSYYGGEYYVTLRLNNMIYGQEYMVSIFNLINESLKNVEYWGSTTFTYNNQGVLDIYRTAPYIMDISIPSSVIVGEHLYINISVYIPKSVEGIKLEVLLDRDGKPPWDKSLSYVKTGLISTGEKSFQLQYIPSTSEINTSYYVYVVVYTKNGDQVYHQLGWEGPVQMYPPIIDISEIIARINDLNLSITKYIAEFNYSLISELDQINKLRSSLSDLSVSLDSTHQEITKLSSYINDLYTKIYSVNTSASENDKELAYQLQQLNDYLARQLQAIKQNNTLIKTSLECKLTNYMQETNNQIDRLSKIHQQDKIELENKLKQINYTLTILLVIIILVLVIVAIFIRRNILK